MRVAGVELAGVLGDALRTCRQHFFAAVAFSFLINLLLLAPAIYMLQVYDRVVATGGKATLFFVTVALALALITMTALDAIRSRLLVRASNRLDSILSPIILNRMLSGGGSQSMQAMRDFDTVRQTLASPVAAAVLDAPWTPIFILFAFLLHFWIGMLALVAIVLLITIAWRNQQMTRQAIEVSSRELAGAHTAAQHVASHGGTVAALGMVKAMTSRHVAMRSDGLSRLMQSQFLGSRYSALSRFLRMFVQSAALGVGALLAIAGSISSGAIVAGSILVGRALQPVEALVSGWPTLSTARASLVRLTEAFAADMSNDGERTRLPDFAGHLEVDQVGVRDENGRPILLGVSLIAGRGDVIGIVGPSGSGKTTLAKVIAGAIEPDHGTVRFDGARRADWDGDLLGRSVGYLPQEPRLFEGSVKDNVSRFSAWEKPVDQLIDQKVIEAAKKAHVHELILGLPQGYDTPLGPNGAGLSAGQSQRIAFARALFGSPSLLILDEPNAFLDAEGEAALVHSIEAERQRGATILIVAHRKGVLAAASRLLVLEAGRVKLLGPSAEVVARLAHANDSETAA